MKKLIVTLALIAGFTFLWPSGFSSFAKEKEINIESVTKDMGNLLKEADDEQIQRLLKFAKDQIEKGNWETEEGIDRAIEEGEKEFLSTENNMIKGIVKTISSE